MMKYDMIEEFREVAKKGPETLFQYFEKKTNASKELIDKIKDASKKEILSPHYPYETKLIRAEYEKDKKDLQVELVKLQRFIKQEDQRLIMVFEGRDAAGKGGTIKRFTEHINPRGARVVALEKPTEIEKGQWYFQRYIHHFPSEGEIVFFDRSWYNRAGVEKVMNFCSEDEYKSFVDHVPEFEEMIITSGIKLVKFWFSVSPEEQLRRFIGRLLDPLKQWKISPMDIQSLGKWTDYTEAKESMFFYTDTPESPWIVIKSDCKKRARLNAMRYILSLYDYKDKDESVVKGIDSKILGPADSIYESDELAHREVLKVKK